MSLEPPKKLTERLESIGAGAYTKGRSDMYTMLRPYMEPAIVNAKKLEASNEGKTSAASVPGTRACELIEKPTPYLKTEQE
jgi:hypothetical protein